MATQYRGYSSPYASGGGNNLNTSEGLYSVAQQVGLGREADRAIEPFSGENGKFGSGGWLSDAFDYLNALSYGTVGMFKGKTFREGIENRESFSDSDSLGKYGVAGKIAGFVADVVVDPLNFIPPLKVLGVMGKAGKLVKLDKAAMPMLRKVIGTPVEIKMAEDLGGGTNTVYVGGLKPITALRNLFEHGWGASKESYASLSKAVGVVESKIHNSARLFDNFSKLDPKIKNSILTRDETGRIKLISKDAALRNFSGKERDTIVSLLDFKDELQKELVAGGGIAKSNVIDDFLTQEYDDILVAKATGPKLAGESGGLYKSRKEMTKEEIAALGPVENADVLLSSTFTKMTRLFADMEVNNSLRPFSFTEEGIRDLVSSGKYTKKQVDEMFTQVENKSQYKVRGRELELKKEIKNVSKQVAPVLKTLKKAFEGNAAKQAEIDGLESWINGLQEAGMDAAEDIIDNLNLAFTGKLGDGGLDTLFGASKAADKDALKFAKERYKELGKLVKDIKDAKVDIGVSKAERAEIQAALVKSEAKLAELRDARQAFQDELAMDATSQLAGRFLPTPLYNQMMSMVEGTDEIGSTIVQAYKNATVVWNPASIARNAMGAIIQNWYQMGIGALNPARWMEAFSIAMNKDSAILREMEKHGLSLGSGQIAEMRRMAINEYTEKAFGAQYGKRALVGRVFDKLKTTMSNAYQMPDNVAKVYAYQHYVARGVPADEAVRLAYKATFNYSEVTPFVRRMRSAIWGVPFATFAIKAVPQTIETALRNPARISIFGKIRNDLFKAAGIEGQEEQGALPDYMHDGFFLRLPFKDGDGNPAYFDLSHIIPFGSIMDGSWKRDPLGQQPALNFAREIATNKTFRGNKIWLEGMSTEDKLMWVGFRMAGMVTPQLIRENVLPDGFDHNGDMVYYGISDEIVNKVSGRALQDPKYMEYFLRNIALKTQTLNVERAQKTQEYAKREALKRVLVDHNVLEEFSRAYLPEDRSLTDYNFEDTGMFGREPRPLGR